MKTKINFKHILSSLALLTIATPAILSVSACGVNDELTTTDRIIKDINKIENLKIDTSSIEDNTTVFDVLSSEDNGLAAKIEKFKIADFDRSLFEIDWDNIYDANQEKITSETIVTNQTYSFKFFYNKKATDSTVAVKIANFDKQVVDAIENAEYTIRVFTNLTTQELTKMIDSSFIKSSLEEETQYNFDSKKFISKSIKVTIDGKEVTDSDLNSDSLHHATINFTYSSIAVKANLELNVVDKEKLLQAIDETTFEKEVVVHTITSASEFKKLINGEFIKRNLADDTKNKFTPSLFKLESITVSTDAEEQEQVDLQDSDLLEKGDLKTQINYNYGSDPKAKESHQATLIIQRTLAELKPEKFVDIVNSRSESNPLTFTVTTLSKDTTDAKAKNIVENIITKTIVNEITDIEKYSIDESKLDFDASKITIAKDETEETFSAEWFKAATKDPFSAKMSLSYAGLSAEGINIKFMVVDEAALSYNL